MNFELTKQISIHILSNLGIIKHPSFNVKNNISILDNKFSIPETLNFDNDGQIEQQRIWGANITIDNQILRILASASIHGDDTKIFETTTLIHLTDSPSYGIYWTNDPSAYGYEEAVIGCSLIAGEWIVCDTYLQATFLAGMEQLKNTILNIDVCSSYQEEYKSLISFNEFVNEMGHNIDER